MRPTLAVTQNAPARTFPTLLYLGLVAGVVTQNTMAKAAGLPSGRVWFATLVLIPVALLGGRLLHVANHWADYRDDRRRILDRATGGMALYGGLIILLPASVAVLAALAVPFWSFWDLAVFPIFITMAAGRFGCLVTGCCGGRITSGRFGLWLRDAEGHRAHRVPAQLLEAGLAAGLLLLAFAVRSSLSRPGELFLTVAVLFGTGRLGLLPLRADRSHAAVTRLISIALVAGGLGGLLWLRL